MSNPSTRSTAVTVAGIIAIIGSAFTVLGVLFGLLGLLIAPHLPQQPQMPTFARTIALATMVSFLAVSVLGICTGAGLLRRKHWARFSALVWAGISAPFSALAFLAILLIPFPSQPGAPAGLPLFLHLSLGALYGIPFGIGIWWLILFNRKTISAEFAAPITGEATMFPGDPLQSSAPTQPRSPLPITVLAWFMLISSLSAVFLLLLPYPAIFFGIALRGWVRTVALVLSCLWCGVAGFGLLRLKRWGYWLAAGLQILGLMNGTITLLSPEYDAIMRESMASMNLPSRVPGLMMEHLRGIASIGLVFPIALLVLLLWYRPRFLEASAAATRS
jgi:uncharacterized membrane protein (DUF2068 family)